MNNHNFICRNCEKTFFVRQYSYVIRDGKVCLAKDYQCYHCQSYDTDEIPRPKPNYSVDSGPAIGKFSSASDEEKKRILSKRAQEHYNKKGKEEKRERFKATMKKMR